MVYLKHGYSGENAVLYQCHTRFLLPLGNVTSASWQGYWFWLFN